ncbi:MAG: hypothetical protein KUG79_03290 [Pseudomonadales bacterium]|nr:hypothetical protein [Pseudomonadales bacterium]
MVKTDSNIYSEIAWICPWIKSLRARPYSWLTTIVGHETRPQGNADIEAQTSTLSLPNLDDIPTILTKIGEAKQEIEDARADINDLSGGASELAFTLSGVSANVSLALAAADRVKVIVENPNLTTVVDLLAEDGETLITDVKKTAILVNNVNTVATKIPELASDDIESMLEVAPALFTFVTNRTNLAVDNMIEERHANIGALLGNTQILMNELKGIAGPNVDLSPFIELFDIMPQASQAIVGEALFVAGADRAFVNELETSANDIATLVDVMGTDTTTGGACVSLVEQRSQTELQSTRVVTRGIGLKMIGATLKGIGNSYLRGPEDDSEFGVHGYTSIKLKNNWAKKLGSITVGIGDGMINVAGLARSKTNDCASQLNQEALEKRFVDVVGDGPWTPGDGLNSSHTLAGIGDGVVNANSTLATIDGNAIAIKINTDLIPAIKTDTDSILFYTNAIPVLTSELAAVKNVSESNSAALTYLVDLLNRSPGLGLGGGVPSKNDDKPAGKNATVATVSDAYTDGVDLNSTENTQPQNTEIAEVDSQRLLLRVQIEQALMDASQSGGLAIFYRPESLGGQLEFVREIVSDTINYNIGAGYAVGAALSSLATADEYMTSGLYKEAWLSFCDAYQESL